MYVNIKALSKGTESGPYVYTNLHNGTIKIKMLFKGNYGNFLLTLYYRPQVIRYYYANCRV